MLSQMQFPGMESMRPALPHEQTEAQFNNRPDVMVHGRMESPFSKTPRTNRSQSQGEPDTFHAGSKQAATERLDNLGTPRRGTTPKFYHGQVDPQQMRNSPDPGKWEPESPPGTYPTPKASPRDPGRMPDIAGGWGRKHLGKYYRNDYEDKGSTSVVLGNESRTSDAPKNFTPWRRSVSNAIRSGEHVPGHVRGYYEASGGAHAPQGLHDPDFRPSTYGSAQHTKDLPMLNPVYSFEGKPGGWTHNV